MFTAVAPYVFLKLNCAICFYLEDSILMCSIYFACGLKRINRLSGIVVAYVTIALSLCLKTKKNAAGPTMIQRETTILARKSYEN